MDIIRDANLGIRFLLELCALAALGYWGYHAGSSTITKLSFAIGMPLIAAVVWGAIVAPEASIAAPAIARLTVEFVVFGSAATGLITTGRPELARLMILVYVMNRALMAFWGQ